MVVAVIKEDGEERDKRRRERDSKRGPFQMSFKERGRAGFEAPDNISWIWVCGALYLGSFFIGLKEERRKTEGMYF